MIIVTGGAGFIGSNILEGLEKNGYKDLVVVDWLGSDDKWKNIAKRNLKDIVVPEEMYEYLEKNKNEIIAIIHMGAISTTTEKDVDLIIKTNFQMSWKLWEFCRDNNKQFIYASSAATYGNGEYNFQDRDDLFYLNKLQPLNPYGWSKLFFDKMVVREVTDGKKTPKQYVGLKFFNVYGPNEYHKGEQKSVIAHIFPQVKNNEEVKLFKSYNPKYKDGEQLRDFVWVGDVVDVIVWMLQHPRINGLFNVGSGEARSFYDLAKATWDAIGKEPKINYKEMPENLKGKYQYYTKANIDKLRLFGYIKEMTSLEDGIKKYVQNYLNNDDMYI